jgi:hypothetical protein
VLGALADEATLPVVDVEPGDTLWDKAAEHLGAPQARGVTGTPTVGNTWLEPAQ